MAVLRLLPSDGIDEIDGSEISATRRLALELLDRTIDDLSDVEVISRVTDEGWFCDVCLDSLHRLPSEVDPILGMREYNLLQARAIVKDAQARLVRHWADAQAPNI